MNQVVLYALLPTLKTSTGTIVIKTCAPYSSVRLMYEQKQNLTRLLTVRLIIRSALWSIKYGTEHGICPIYKPEKSDYFVRVFLVRLSIKFVQYISQKYPTFCACFLADLEYNLPNI